MPLTAATEVWPFVIFAVLFALFGRKRPPARGRSPSPTARPAEQGTFLGQLQQALEEMKKAEGEARRKAVVRPVRALPFDDDDKSPDESAPRPEERDYDEEAERVVAARQRAAERVARTEVSAEGLSAAQLERRGERKAVPLGTAQEHGAWHRQISQAAAPAPVPAKRRALQRFSDGSARGAIIIAEILGRPKGAR